MKLPHYDCIRCKGKLLCGKSFCPIYSRADTGFKIVKDLSKDEFFGSSPPSVFVGSSFYPYLNVGVLSPTEIRSDSWLFDSPKYWALKNYSAKKIVGYRSSLVNSRFRANVFDVRKSSKFLDLSQEIAMAYKPVNIEVELEHKLRFRVNFSDVEMPMGPNSSLRNLRLTSNPKISTKVEKVVSDTDLKAAEAIKYLYNSEMDENFLSKLLSIGVLGLKKNRKLVPLRWSITGTDDTIGKTIIKEIKNYNSIDNYRFYFGNYLGNYYFVMMFPSIWSYELFETYLPKSTWNFSGQIETTTDNEDYYGRKKYADNTVGGYYSCRLAVLEKLRVLKRQAGVLVLRFITDDYEVPLGVWVTRESTRKAVNSEGFEFDSREKMLDFVKAFVISKFNYNIENLLSKSKFLEAYKNQKRLRDFF